MQAQQVLSVMGSVSNLNSFSSNGFKGLASFPNIPGLTGPLSQDFHPDLALGAHMHSQNQLSGPPPTRNVLMPGAGAISLPAFACLVDDLVSTLICDMGSEEKIHALRLVGHESICDEL